MRKNQIFTGKYLNAETIKARGPTVFTIDRVEIEDVGQGAEKRRRPVIYFREDLQSLVCNSTNWDLLALMFGDESDDWIGARFQLFVTKVPFAGKMVDAIRVKPISRRSSEPPPDVAPPPSSPDDYGGSPPTEFD